MTFSKALWVVRDRITTKPAIDDLLADSVGWNVRDLVVQVRGRGDAYYTSTLELHPDETSSLVNRAVPPVGSTCEGPAA